MVLEDIKLKDISEDNPQSPYYFRNRVVDIITDKGTFTTPNRLTTRTEYVARSMVPFSESLNLDLAIDFRELTVEQTEQLTSDLDCVKSLLALAEQFGDITRRALFKLSVFQPPYSKLSTMSTTEKTKFADFQADLLQLRFGSDIISYPYLAFPISEYKKFIDERNIRDEHKSTVFTFDLAMDPNDLKEILDYLIKNKEPTIICLIDRPWFDTPIQHSIISSYFHEEKTIFLACQVERIAPQSTSSNLHALAFAGGFDLVSLYQARGGGGDKKLSLDKIKFFNPKTLEITSIENTVRELGRNLVDEFEFSWHNQKDKEYISMILEGYEGALSHPKKHQILYYLARSHEAMTSPKVFAQTREKILSHEIESYISNTNLKQVPMILNPRNSL